MSIAQPNVLWERDAELAGFRTALRSAETGAGRVVLVTGEAGIGKSRLVDVAGQHARAAGVRVLWAACDDLLTSRTLGPLRDLAEASAGPLNKALQKAVDREELLRALREELVVPPHPTLLIVEDLQWADDATIDVLAWLSRRIAGLPCCLALTYRPQDIDAAHPFRRVLGRLTDAPVVRLPLEPLSVDAVHAWVGDAPDVDVAAVHEQTAGNPFFLAEVLAAPSTGVPLTVAEAVLNRLHRLTAAAQQEVEQLSVLPGGLRHEHAAALFGDAVDPIAEAESRGLLTVSGVGISFRHELARRAVLESLPAARSRLLHQLVLSMLLSADPPDPSLILHHAEALGDETALTRFGPAAARDAAAAGAHRQAVQHFQRLVRVQRSFRPLERVELLQGLSAECFATGDPARAVAAQEQAVTLLRRHCDDRTALSMALRWLSRLWVYAGQDDASDQAAREALAVLDPDGEPLAVAWAQSNAAQLAMLSNRDRDAEALAERAAASARATRDPAVIAHALNNLGVIRWRLGRAEEGAALLQQSLRTALDHHLDDDACRAYVNWVGCLIDAGRDAEAERRAVEGIAVADRTEQVSYLRFLQTEHAVVLLHTGHWTDAVSIATRALAGPADASTPFALAVIGAVRVRSGDESVDEVLNQAIDAAQGTSLQRILPVAAMAAEHAWLRDNRVPPPEVLDRAYAVAVARDHPAAIAELSYWRWKLGIEDAMPEGDDPFVLQRRGRPHAAAELWRGLGRPYEQARALSEAGDPQSLAEALTLADRLGAQPLERRIRDALGTAGINPAPAVARRRNPFGLTDRQLEVLTLLQEGMTNAEIAAQLWVSVRTVDHHVAAVLSKLGAPTRRAAVRRAADLLADNRAPGPAQTTV